MSQNPHDHFDHTVLDLIEHSPTGAVPTTPAYQDAIGRLYTSHQAYPSADFANGHVTARSLANLPVFEPKNLDAFLAGEIDAAELEPNLSIFDRYIASLPAAQRARAESYRLSVAGRRVHHRLKTVGDAKVPAQHDPLHTLFLFPGAGPHPGLPGNYLHGAVVQINADDTEAGCSVQVHDSDDGAAVLETPNLAAAFAEMREVVGSAPFHLQELEALGFHMI